MNNAIPCVSACFSATYMSVYIRDASTRIEAIWRDPAKSTSAIPRGVGRYVWLKARPPSPVECTVRRTKRQVKIDENYIGRYSNNWAVLPSYSAISNLFNPIRSFV